MRISDWSSDVCSSDLHSAGIPRAAARARARSGSPFYGDAERGSPSAGVLFEPRDRQEFFGRDADRGAGRAGAHAGEIGRASCRESACQYGEISVVAVSLKKKQTQNDITTTTSN